jgi:hypothetical protein
LINQKIQNLKSFCDCREVVKNNPWLRPETIAKPPKTKPFDLSEFVAPSLIALFQPALLKYSVMRGKLGSKILQ